MMLSCLFSNSLTAFISLQRCTVRKWASAPRFCWRPCGAISTSTPKPKKSWRELRYYLTCELFLLYLYHGNTLVCFIMPYTNHIIVKLSVIWCHPHATVSSQYGFSIRSCCFSPPRKYILCCILRKPCLCWS